MTLWHPQTNMAKLDDEQRLVFVRGEGAYVQTADGRRLLDATAGLWHANVGHGRPSIAQAAAAQMETLETYHLFGGWANRPAIELAERVATLGPIADPRIFWTSGGSDAVDLACKLARRYWSHHGHSDKRIIATRRNGYHGLHGFGTSIAGIASNRDGYGTESLVPETLRIDTNDLAAVEAEILTTGPDRIAAIIAEPVMGTGGVIAPSPGYLDGLQQLCRDHQILFVADEVITGFGRVGTMFACERFGIDPDMVLVAKGITSGYAPLGGVLIAPSVWEPFFSGDDAPVFHHGLTYSGHATACAVAQANLDIIESEGLVTRVAKLEPALRQALGSLAGHPLVEEVRCSTGFMGGVKLVADAPGGAIARAAIDAGVITRVLNDNVLQICPPFIVTAEEIDTIGRALADALDRAGAPA